MRSSLSKRLPRSKTDEQTLAALRRKAWLEEGVATFRLGDIVDEWERQIVANIANRLYGKREMG